MFYIDCTDIPLEHLEMLVREVYLPLLCTNQSNIAAAGGDKVLDVLHRLMSIVEISQGHVEVTVIFFFNNFIHQKHQLQTFRQLTYLTT